MNTAKGKKPDAAFNADFVAANLPREPPPGLAEDIQQEYNRELGGDLCVFSRVSWSPSDEDGPPQWINEEPLPRHWAARCRCTRCGTQWLSGWISRRTGYVAGLHPEKRGGPGIRVFEAPDGAILFKRRNSNLDEEIRMEAG